MYFDAFTIIIWTLRGTLFAAVLF